MREIVVSRRVEALLDGGEDSAESGDVVGVHGFYEESRAKMDGQEKRRTKRKS